MMFFCGGALCCRAATSVAGDAPKVPGVTGYAAVLKIETAGDLYQVTELHGVTNDSRPPRTQIGPHNLEVRLPERAVLDSVMVAGPGRPLTKVEPELLNNGRYAIGYPLFPGITKYAVRYHVPQAGGVVFHPWLTYPVSQWSALLPRSIEFKPASGTAYHRIIDRNGVQVQAIDDAKAGELPEFGISGSGTLKRPDSQPKTVVPVASAPPSAGKLFWIVPVGISGAIIVVAIALQIRRRRLTGPSYPVP
jgi:hypothetical protein